MTVTNIFGHFDTKSPQKQTFKDCLYPLHSKGKKLNPKPETTSDKKQIKVVPISMFAAQKINIAGIDIDKRNKTEVRG